MVYDTVTGALSHLPAVDQYDLAGTRRELLVLGQAVTVASLTATQGVFQFTYDQPIASTSSPVIKYQSSGKLVSSLLDFGTPTISKLLRRVILRHAPLPLNASIKVDVFTDQDPRSYTSSLVPTATRTNSTQNSSTTVLTMPSGTLAKTLYYVLTLTTSDNLNTPQVYTVAVEVGVGWTWTFRVGCFRKQQTLAGQDDSQGLTGRDKYFFLHEFWENAQPGTFYHPNQLSYTVVLERMDLVSLNPVFHSGADGPADLEFVADITLRWSQE